MPAGSAGTCPTLLMHCFSIFSTGTTSPVLGGPQHGHQPQGLWRSHVTCRPHLPGGGCYWAGHVVCTQRLLCHMPWVTRVNLSVVSTLKYCVEPSQLFKGASGGLHEIIITLPQCVSASANYSTPGPCQCAWKQLRMMMYR
jgi:hypothetical protein